MKREVIACRTKGPLLSWASACSRSAASRRSISTSWGRLASRRHPTSDTACADCAASHRRYQPGAGLRDDRAHRYGRRLPTCLLRGGRARNGGRLLGARRASRSEPAIPGRALGAPRLQARWRCIPFLDRLADLPPCRRAAAAGRCRGAGAAHRPLGLPARPSHPARQSKDRVFFGAVFVGMVPEDAPIWAMVAIPVMIFLDEMLWYAFVGRVFSLAHARRSRKASAQPDVRGRDHDEMAHGVLWAGRSRISIALDCPIC